MRKALIVALVAYLASLGAPVLAFAAEDASALALVEKLAAHVAEDGADFESTNELYKAAKEALELEAKKHPEDQRPGAKRYAEIQPKVAEVMLRESLPASAWIMGVFGATLLWGGLAFCIGVARKKGGANANA